MMFFAFGLTILASSATGAWYAVGGPVTPEWIQFLAAGVGRHPTGHAVLVGHRFLKPAGDLREASPSSLASPEGAMLLLRSDDAHAASDQGQDRRSVDVHRGSRQPLRLARACGCRLSRLQHRARPSACARIHQRPCGADAGLILNARRWFPVVRASSRWSGADPTDHRLHNFNLPRGVKRGRCFPQPRWTSGHRPHQFVGGAA